MDGLGIRSIINKWRESYKLVPEIHKQDIIDTIKASTTYSKTLFKNIWSDLIVELEKALMEPAVNERTLIGDYVSSLLEEIITLNRLCDAIKLEKKKICESSENKWKKKTLKGEAQLKASLILKNELLVEDNHWNPGNKIDAIVDTLVVPLEISIIEVSGSPLDPDHTHYVGDRKKIAKMLKIMLNYIIKRYPGDLDKLRGIKLYGTQIYKRVKKGKVLKINSTIAQIDPKNLPVLEHAISDFKEAQSSNTSSLLNCQETLFNNIRNMTDDSKSNALDLFDNMKYPKGRNQGKIISPHIQKKAIDFLNYGLYKKKSTIKDLEEENKELKSQIKKFGKEKEKLIKKTQSLGASKQHFKTKSEKRVSTIRSLVRKSGNFSENEFKNQVKSLFKINKNEYSPQMVWLATRITQVGQVSMHSTVECLRLVYQFLIGEKPKKWLSRSTLSTWHQEVANLEVHSTITQLSEVNSYGIMVDESTRGENKYLVIVFAFWSYVENFPLAKVIELKVISKCDNPHPRIYTESGFKNLPNGRRAHEMPDKVTEWLSFLRDLKENFDIVFGQELLEALELLDSDEWGSLYDSLERGIIKALEHFENWMLPWLHLPLSICRLGGDNGQAFARSYYYVFFITK
ncbi:4193_t:CDS:2 [Entrophospora sp. SA101]|nr:4193_t:CDS:2 [Entrophospora sp. SA101]